MIFNLLLVSSVLSTFVEAIHLDETNSTASQKIEMEAVKVDNKFVCLTDSFFDAIIHEQKFDEPGTCNRFMKANVGGGDDHYFGLRKNKSPIVLTAPGTALLIDTDGEENVTAGLFITSGKCEGDLMFFNTIGKVVRGSCTSDTGVTEIDTFPEGQAVLAIVGKM